VRTGDVLVFDEVYERGLEASELAALVERNRDDLERRARTMAGKPMRG
jgi:hypothetical protein